VHDVRGCRTLPGVASSDPEVVTDIGLEAGNGVLRRAAGQDYFGEILLGPTSAPTALTVPVKITRTA